MGLLTTIGASFGIKSAIAENQAQLLQKQGGTDLFNEMNTAEDLGECQTIRDAIKNPLFFKGLTLLMLDYMETLKKRKNIRVNDVMLTKDYREKGFLPIFFSPESHPYPYENASYYLAEQYLQQAFQQGYNGDNALTFLKKVFHLGKVDTVKNTKSLFRNQTGEISTNGIKIGIEVVQEVRGPVKKIETS